MSEEVERQLLNVAKQASFLILHRGDLETRNNDNEDFLEIPVWTIKRMLEEAYKLGKESK